MSNKKSSKFKDPMEARKWELIVEVLTRIYQEKRKEKDI